MISLQNTKYSNFEMKTKKIVTGFTTHKPYLLQFQQNLNLFGGMVEATPHVFRSFVFHSRPSFSVDHIVLQLSKPLYLPSAASYFTSTCS
jgi:hypothetical protein